jgi:hypothetical protein
MVAVARRIPKGTVLGWGAGLLGATITPRYLYPWYNDQLAEVGELGLLAPRPGVLKNFRVVHTIPDGNGNLITYTVRVGGVNSPLAVAFASTDAFGFDLTNAISVSAGDRVSVLVTKVLSVGASPRNIVATADLV